MRRLWACLLLCAITAGLVAPSFGAIPQHIRLTLEENPDGTRDTRFRNGDKPPNNAILECDDSAAPSLTGLVTGNAYSADVRQYFSGTAAATATLTVVTVSGDDATSEGWAIGGDNLTHNGSGTGSGGLLIRGTTASTSKDCSVRSWSYVSAPSADTTAPTVPTGLTTTAVSGGVKLDWDASSDPYVSEAGAGVDEYDVRLGSTVVQTVTTGISASTMPQLTASSIGTVTNTSASQNGSNWTLAARGAGFTGTSDNGYFLGALFAGDFTITYKVASFDSALPFGHCGGMVRQSLDADSPFGFVFQSTDETSIGIRAQVRPVTAGTKTTLVTAASLAAPNWQQITRVGNTLSYAYSTDGNAFTALASGSVPMASTVYAGIALASQDTNTTVTCEIEQLSITTAPGLSYTHTTGVGGNYSIRARDTDGNNSNYGAVVAGTPSGGGGEDVKWHPGHYVLSNSTGEPGNVGYTPAHVSALSSQPNVKGWQQRLYWSVLEPTRGNYDFSRIDTLLALATAAGKQLIIQLQDRTFGGTATAAYLPQYLLTEIPSGGICIKPNNAGVVAKQWVAAVMTRFVLLAQAMAAHSVPNTPYTLDTHPNFEGIVSVESSPGGVAYGTCDLGSRTQLAEQLKRWPAEVKPYWPHTNVWANTNFLSGEIEGLLSSLVASQAGVSGPDTVPSPAPPDPGFGTTAQRVWMGYREATVNGALSTLGAHDYRGQAPALWQVQSPELGCRKEGDHTLDDIADFGALIGATHMAWLRHAPPTTYCTENNRPYNTWTDRCERISGNLSCNSAQGISDFLDGTPPALTTACPSIYSGCD